MRGRIEVVCGPMFGGKSEELLRRLHRVELASQPYLLFKPAIDDRYSKDEVVSHAGRRKNCYLIDSAEEMLTYPLVSVVGVDEAQFIEGAVHSSAMPERDLSVQLSGWMLMEAAHTVSL